MDYVTRETLHPFCLKLTSKSGTLSPHILVMKMHNLKELRPRCSSAVQSKRCIVSVWTSVDRKRCSPERVPLHSIVNRWIKLISLCTGSEWLYTFCRGHDVIAQHVRATLKGILKQVRAQHKSQPHKATERWGRTAEALPPQLTVLAQPEGPPSKQTAQSRRLLGGPSQVVDNKIMLASIFRWTKASVGELSFKYSFLVSI